MHLNVTPNSIPGSKAKRKLLDQEGVPNIYLGQGLKFVAPETANELYNKYLKDNKLKPEDLPLDTIQKKGKGGDIYNSARLDEVWDSIYHAQRKRGYRSPEAFGTFIREQSRETMQELFQIDANDIATTQVDNLMQALGNVQAVIPKLTGKHLSRVILPDEHKYSGHTDFTGKAKEIGIDMEIVEVPEIQLDGTQDLGALKAAFEQIKSEGRVALFIDQEHNNNPTGFDRDPAQNDELIQLLKEYEGVIFYFGDNAYKGLKLDVLDPYPLMQGLIDNEVTSFHYTSFTKLGNYRGVPANGNILTATPGEFADKEKLRATFQATQRSRGIGAHEDGAILMHELAHDPQFQSEVRISNQYLQYIRDALFKALEGTDLAPLFSQNTSGIFRCLPSEVTAKLNSGPKQVITVGDRVNIHPLGDPKVREFFIEQLKDAA